MAPPEIFEENTTEENEPILLTVKQVGHLVGLCERSIWRLSGSGKFPAPISLGRSKRWYRKSVEEFAAAKAEKKRN